MVGKTLGHYEILEPLGAGGMGEVYRARDTKLDRDVAIKVLPEDFATDPDRLARFEREAKLLASLNHANIAAIYGIEDEGDQRFIAMELVEGETLAESIARSGRIEIDEALAIACQVAEALEAAHGNGVIHRDLKPANIIVSPDGRAKVLDFGLAKAYESDGSAPRSLPDLSHSPTVMAATRTGVIMGTAAYMSPEQAKGKALDKRTDIWSFGALLFEMLAGRVAFPGEDASETLASILKDEPDWAALPDGLPASVNRLLRRCLAKDARERMRDAGDARLEIGEARAAPEDEAAAPAGSRSDARLGAYAWPVVAASALLTAGAVWVFRPLPVAPTPVRLVASLPAGQELRMMSNPLAVSPDGRSIVYAAEQQPSGASQLYLRPIDEFEAQALDGTEGAQSPFFSPDGASIGYFANDGIWTMRLPDGPPVEVAQTSLLFPSGTWGPDGTIVFTHFSLGLARVSVNSEDPPVLITEIDQSAGEVRHMTPQFLPDGRILFTVQTNERLRPRAAVMSLEDRTQETVLENAENARYVASGHIIYSRAADLMAVSFDIAPLTAGTSVPVNETIVHIPSMGDAHFAVSDSGTLVFAPADEAISFTAVWVDREGNVEKISDDADYFDFPRVSPDGRNLAVTRAGEIWVYDLGADSAVGVPRTNSGFNLEAVWSPGGELTFTSHGPRTFFDLHRTPADGSGAPRLLLEREGRQFVSSFSGEKMAFYERTEEGLNVVVRDGDQEPLVWSSEHDEHTPMFHPGGHWIAYASDQSQLDEIWVREYPEGRKTIAAAGGGTQPLWSPDGDELYFRRGDTVFAVPFDATEDSPFGTPAALFRGDYFRGNGGGGLSYGIHPQDKRFVMLQMSEPGATRINVVVNWFEELNVLVPAGR